MTDPMPDAALVIGDGAARFDPDPVNTAPACPLCGQGAAHEVCGVPPTPQPACPACGSTVVAVHVRTDRPFRCGGCDATLERFAAAAAGGGGGGLPALLGLRR